MNISKLLKKLFLSMLMLSIDEPGPAAEPAFDPSAPENDDDVMGLLSDYAGNSTRDQDNGFEEPQEQQQQQQQQTAEPTQEEKDAQAAAELAAAQEAAKAAEKTFKLKINGEERAFTEAELIVAAQKGEAAAQKFEEAANIRKQAEPELVAARQERQHLKQALEVFIPQLQHLLQVNAPDPQLINTDPQEYMRQNYAYQDHLARLQQAQAAQAELTRREQQEQVQQFQARSAEEQGKLLKALPEWADPAKAKEEASAVDGYLRDAGFSDQERGSFIDHRIVLVAREAMLYRKFMQQQAQATQRVQNLPPKVERPGNGVQPGDGRTRAMKNHAQHGSVESGAAAILQFLE